MASNPMSKTSFWSRTLSHHSTMRSRTRLVDEGTVRREERVVCVLTGHVLKDPDVIVKGGHAAGRIVEIEPALDDVRRALDA